VKKIVVLGSGCSKCTKTAELIESTAARCGVEVDVAKEASPEVMMRYGVMRTPAVVVDNVLKHSGSIPRAQAIEEWLQ
jgi:hypothetical protein